MAWVNPGEAPVSLGLPPAMDATQRLWAGLPLRDTPTEAFLRGAGSGAIPTIARGLTRELGYPDFPKDPGYNLFLDPQVHGYEDVLPFLASSHSADDTANRLKIVQRMRMDTLRLDGRGAAAGFGALAGSLMDPTMLIGLGEVKAIGQTLLGAGRASTVIGEAWRMAKQTALIGGAEEAATSLANPIRPEGEATHDLLSMVAANTFLGALRGFVSTPARAVDRLGRQFQRLDPLALPAPETGGAAGAAPAPGAVTMGRAERMFGEAMAKAYGVETLGVNPILRLLRSSSETARELVGRLTEIAGFQNKNMRGVATEIPVWSDYRLLKGAYGEALKATDELYMAHLERLAAEAGVPNPAAGMAGRIKTGLLGGRGFPSKAEFYREVGWAKSELGTEAVGWRSPEATQAAKLWDEKVYKPISEMAHENGATVYGLKRELERAEANVRSAPPGAEAARAASRVAELKAAITDIEQHGVYKPAYLNRIWLHGAVQARRAELAQIIASYARIPLDQAQEVIDRILKLDAFVPIGPDAIGRASGLHERSLAMVPDSALEGFIERDISIAGQHYTRQTGVDALMARAFNGDIDMRDAIKAVEDENKALIAASTNATEKRAAEQAAERDLDDLRALRDLIRGTYGLPDNPHGYMSRAIRFAKNWNVLTQLTGFVSAIPDLARLPMTEGFNKALGAIFQAFMDQAGGFKLAQKELNLAGEALDMMMGFRAATMSDIADSFSTSNKVERLVQHAASARFTIDGLNFWTDQVKSIASMIVGTRIIESVEKWAAGSISEADKAKLARAHIDGPMAERIAAELERHASDHGAVRIANTELWTDAEAVRHFRAALAKDVNIAVVTPAPGEKPLWMSTQLGGLLAQYKGFGMSSTMRVLLPGLQAPDRNFLLGAVALVGLGGLTDMLQSQRRGEDYGKKNGARRFSDALDRSGLLGYFMDVNNMAEGTSFNAFGLRPFLGASRGPGSTRQAAGAFGGPSVSQIMDAITSIGPTEDPRVHQARRRLVPLGRVWHLDPIFDQIAGT